MSDPVAGSSRPRHFRLRLPALAATAVSLGGYALCSYYEKSSALLVGLGLLLAFGGFLGVSLAMILDSDHEDEAASGSPAASSRSERA